MKVVNVGIVAEVLTLRKRDWSSINCKELVDLRLHSN